MAICSFVREKTRYQLNENRLLQCCFSRDKKDLQLTEMLKDVSHFESQECAAISDSGKIATHGFSALANDKGSGIHYTESGVLTGCTGRRSFPTLLPDTLSPKNPGNAKKKFCPPRSSIFPSVRGQAPSRTKILPSDYNKSVLGSATADRGF